VEYVEAWLPVLFSNIGLGMKSKTVDQRSSLLCCSKRCKIIIAQATKRRPYIYQNDIKRIAMSRMTPSRMTFNQRIGQ
jgi:hypothetical protein